MPILCYSDKLPELRMQSQGLMMLVAVLCAGAPLCVRGDDFTIEVGAHAPEGQQKADSGAKGTAAAPLAAKPGDRLILQWAATNPQRGTLLPNVTLHVVLDRQGGSGKTDNRQSAAPAVYESAWVMDFDAGSKTSGEVLIQAPGSGDYLLRVETIGAAARLGREKRAIISLRVR